jgi:small subunit ribosomal protein S20
MTTRLCTLPATQTAIQTTRDMPNTKQAKKRMRQDEERRIANKSIASEMKSTSKKVMQAETAEAALAALPEAMKKVDKAAKKNLIHANAADRRKSRLVRAANAK